MEQNGKLTSQELDSVLPSSQNVNSEDCLLSDPHEYQRLVGRLIYLTITRPDICYAIQSLIQFMHAPKTSYLEAALRVVKYIKKIPGQGLLFQPSASLTLTTYCDSDWATCPITRRSVTCYCIKLGSSLISWTPRSKTQSLDHLLKLSSVQWPPTLVKLSGLWVFCMT